MRSTVRRFIPVDGKTTDNSDVAAAAKLDMRCRIRALVEQLAGGARVLECMCGVEGRMSEAWRGSAVHEGIDQRFELTTETRRRYVGDAALVLRGLDLARFNVFDVDAYGSPWPYLATIEARRRWKRGEHGAIVATDGSPLKLQLGAPVFDALARYLGSTVNAPTVALTPAMFRQALRTWMRRAGVAPVKVFFAVNDQGRPYAGLARCGYYGAVFVGV